MESRIKRKKPFFQSDMMRLLMQEFTRLSIEKKAIIASHGAVILFSFFPWVRLVRERGDEIDITLFLSGNVALLSMLMIVFLSLLVLFLFVDKLLNLKIAKVPFSLDYIYAIVGAQQFILLFLSLSSILIWVNLSGDSHISFGFFACFVAIVSGIVATFLDIRNEKKKKTQAFFQSPSVGGMKSEAPKKEDTQSSEKTTAPRLINQIDKD